ncbi:MAG: nicotinate-nucleotide--dimethylbenzimidazole phosphoribosyltransferase [Thalassobaculales bacterium]
MIDSLATFRRLCASLPAADEAAGAAAAARQAVLTKPPGSLGRLEAAAIHLARWQGRAVPRLEDVRCVIFAGNHGVAARGVSAYPAAVTAQMVANFAAGGAAINQLCAVAGAALRVVPLALDRPTTDFCERPAMSEAELVEALDAGWRSVEACDLAFFGEMGIANTTVAAALAAALLGGGSEAWVGRGTGVDDGGLGRKRTAVAAGLLQHAGHLDDPLEALRRLGGREVAALAGAILAARHARVPVLLDGFVVTAAAAVLKGLAAGALDHCLAGHRSAESAHGRLLAELGLDPLLDLGMRLGEGSGAAVAVLLLRAACAAHGGMASFAEAGVSGGAPR